MRISRQQMFMEMAEAAAKRSTCFRLNVGAIIVKDNNVLSIGYNGPPSGEPHCTGNACSGKDLCMLTIHAEKNAIERSKTFLINADMYVTDSPCDDCTDLLIRHHFKRLFFGTPYRVIEPINRLIAARIDVYRVTPAGFVIDWRTREFTEIKY